VASGRGGDSAAATIDDGLACLTVLDAAGKSAASGSAVPPGDWRTSESSTPSLRIAAS
jgi:hypothetical protein